MLTATGTLTPCAHEVPVLAWSSARAYTSRWPAWAWWLPVLGMWPLLALVLWVRLGSGGVARLRDGRGTAVMVWRRNDAWRPSGRLVAGGLPILGFYVVLMVLPTVASVLGWSALAVLARVACAVYAISVIAAALVFAAPEFDAQRRAADRARRGLPGVIVEQFAAWPTGVGLGADLWQQLLPAVEVSGVPLLARPRSQALSERYQRRASSLSARTRCWSRTRCGHLRSRRTGPAMVVVDNTLSCGRTGSGVVVGGQDLPRVEVDETQTGRGRCLRGA